MIQAHNISLDINNRLILHPIDLEIGENEFCVVIGANGAGKSSLLHILAGSQKPSYGSIRVDQKLIDDWNPIQLAQKRAFLQQASILSVNFSVKEVLILGRFPYKNESPAELELELNTIIEQFHLQDIQNCVYNHLSGGEKQRVQFARVLLQLKSKSSGSEKSILFLDEPLNNLDIKYQIELLLEAKKFVDEGKGTVIAVVHDLNLSFQFADRAILLNNGQLIADGPVEDVFVPEILSEAFKTKINLYETSVGMQYFFAENGQNKSYSYSKQPIQETNYGNY
jgi:iron complex transport system ATP-binding protein